ncbi:hypothetical protein HMPREF3027_04240 [Porphyromonas sp. HMSC077F02]|uniref:hypothetical protein n=1 Tax=Porphyromonas sp. HMSC077F02 TaxID=1739529 RepID=UPI0008A4D1B3|nr:hypothetical protein [Porphyromonas sp. HMSC077F02]OFO54323.1 hypothetical protein HMPREF3027_04240 [Porphyromonas sp. HMSC077F02]
MDKKTTRRVYGYTCSYLLLTLSLHIANHFFFESHFLQNMALYIPFMMPLHMMGLRQKGKMVFDDTTYLLMFIFMMVVSMVLYTLFYFL